MTYNGGTGGGNWYHFDILEAAKAWANGTQDPAKGLVFKAADSFENQTANVWYKTFSSYNRSSYKPSLKITYNTGIAISDANIPLLEGATYTLQVTTNAASVTWASDNTAVATVDANGIVTAIKAGVANITATITGADGTSASDNCTVYVHIPNGIYYITNSYSNQVLMVDTLSILDGTNVINSVLASSATETYQIRQMWKIAYLGNGRYSIRPLHKLDMGLTSTNGNADIKNIGATDTLAGLSDLAEWTIEAATLGYFIKQNDSDSGVLQLENETTIVGENVIVSSSTSGYGSEWELVSVTTIPSGVLLYNTETGSITTNPIKTINPKNTFSLSQLNLETTVYSGSTNSQSLYWYSSDTGVVTVDDSSGSVTGVSHGTATITARKYIDGTYYYVSYKVKVNNNAVIIVPGIMGTELIAGSNNSNYEYGTKLWSTDLIDEYDSGDLSALEIAERIISLRCDSNGNSRDDIIPYNNTYGADDTYKSLYNSLCNAYQDEYSINFFAYDWRLSNSNSANELNSFINNCGYDNVILVCHSMGGLVASGYLSLGETQRNKVETVITLGSPLLGTSVVPYLWGSEDANVTGVLDLMGIPDWGATLVDFVTLYYDPLDYLMGNFSSMYEMFPSEKYFDSSYSEKNYLITSIAGTNDQTITTYADTRKRLDSYLNHFNTDLADSAESFHNSLYIGGDHVTGLVNTYYIAGYGYQTVNMVEFDMWDWYIYSYTNDGDEMVAEWSATLGDKYSGRTFYAQNVSHMGLVSNSEVRSFVIQLIEGNTSISSYSKIFNNLP